MKKLLAILVTTTAVVITVALLYTNSSDANAYELAELNENGEKLWADADRLIEPQLFSIDGTTDTVLETKSGLVMYVPEGCFVDENGTPIKDGIELEVKEALDAESIMKAGLSSKSGDKLLESAGMFYINARKDGKTLQFHPDKGIYTQVPTNEIKEGMQLFEGKRLEDGSIDWVDPKPLDKFLTTVDINTLNFYPSGYEPKLKALGQRDKKAFKDSLYYSFAWEDSPNSNGYMGEVPDSLLGREDDAYKMGLLTKTTSTPDCIGLNTYHSGDGRPATVIIDGESHRTTDFCEWDWYIENVGCNEYVIHQIFFINEHLEIYDRRFKPEKNGTKYEPLWEEHNKGLSDNIKTKYNPSDFKEVLVSSLKIKLKTTEYFAIRLNYESRIYGQGDERPQFNTVIIVPESSGNEKPVDEGVICGINPAKIKAIWNKEFNNSIIATKEFEERLQTIFTTCNDAILDLYINNLDKNLYQIDEMATQQTSGAVKAKFAEYSRRKDGKVDIDEKRLKKLKKHYKQQQKIVAKAVAKAKKKFEKEQQKLLKAMREKNTEFYQKEAQRINDNYLKELDINLDEAYRQLGKERPDAIRPNRNYSLTVRRPGWKNVDVYVQESLKNRESLDYTDPQTGKKAVIEYHPLAVSISKESEFDRVVVYILPQQLNSFMRLKQKDGMYQEKLNELLTNDLICLGYKGKQAYLHSKENIEPGEYMNLVLDQVSDTDLKKTLAKYNRTQQENLADEFEYQLAQAAEQIRQQKLADQSALRREIEKVIFPCGVNAVAEEVMMVDSIAVGVH